jgi:hypothetical protein
VAGFVACALAFALVAMDLAVIVNKSCTFDDKLKVK